MKFIVSFVAAFCAVQVVTAGPLDQLKNTLDRSKSNVQSIMSDIRRTRNNLEFTTKNQISNLKIQSMTNINNFVNPALAQIRTDVDAAKASGKDAEVCYTNAKDSLRTLSQAGFQDLNTCQSNAEQLLRVQTSALDAAESTGNSYLNELNSVFPNCYSSNIMQMQSCIAIKLGSINTSIRTYQSTVDSLKRDVQNAANKVTLSASTCNYDAVSKVRSGTTDVRITATKCVKN